jgi:hypothetical protein
MIEQQPSIPTADPPTTTPQHYTPQTWKLVLGRHHTYFYSYVLELLVGPNLLLLLEMGSMMVVGDKIASGWNQPSRFQTSQMAAIQSIIGGMLIYE